LANYINNHHLAKVVTLYMHWDSKKILWEIYRYMVWTAAFGTMCSKWYSSTSQLQFCHHLGEPPAHRPVGNSGLKG
jgi:hypothetical protein